MPGRIDRVLYFGVTTAAKMMNGLFAGWGTGGSVPTNPYEFVFNCDYDFTGLYDGSADFFKRTENRELQGRYNMSVWHTNFIPNVFDETVEDFEQKVAGGQLTGYRMGGGFPAGHISEWPVGRYHKAHHHGPGALLFGLKGKGYVNLWPRELGIHPWQDGHGDQVALVEWGPNSIYAPLDGWYHQHMSTGKGPARHVATYGAGDSPMTTHVPIEEEDETSARFDSVREGGALIEYEDEDPEVRRYFIEANRKEGVDMRHAPGHLPDGADPGHRLGRRQLELGPISRYPRGGSSRAPVRHS